MQNKPRAWEAPLNAATDWHRYTERSSVEHTHLTPYLPMPKTERAGKGLGLKSVKIR